MAFDRDSILRKFRELDVVLREGEQGLTENYGPALTVTRMETPMDSSYTERVRRSVRELLALAPVTEGFRTYVEGNVMCSYDLGLPPQLVIRSTEIDPEKGGFGYFDPEKAEEIERGKIKDAAMAEIGLRGICDPGKKDLIRRWEQQIEEKYRRSGS